MNTSLPALWQEQEGNNAVQLDIRQMLMSVYRHKWPILALSVLAAIIAFLYASSLVPIYQAKGTLLIESEDANIVSIQDVYSTGYRGYEYRLTQHELLKSRNLAERVVRKLELHKDPRFVAPQQKAEKDSGWRDWIDFSFLKPAGQEAKQQKVAEPTPEELEAQQVGRVAATISSGITVTQLNDSQIFSITYRSHDPEFAAKVVNTLADQYIESYLDARLGATQRASEWLTDRLAGLKESLIQAEQRLQAFTEQEKLVDMEGISTLGAQQIADLTKAYNEAREKRITAQNIRQEVERLGRASTAQYLTVPAVQRHELISSLRQMQADAQRKVNELGRRYGVKHPRMIAANSELTSIQDDLSLEVSKVIAGIDTEYQLALRTEQTLSDQLEVAKADYREVNRKDFALKELQREVDTNRQLYDLFFTRMKETTQAGQFEKANARVIDAAQVPTGPVSPNKRMIVLAGLFGGLVLGMAVAVLQGVLDNTIKVPEDVAVKLNASLLGTLPLQKEDKDGHFVSYWENQQSNYAEAVRTIRTAVVLSGLDKPHKIIVITSSLPAEGKSAISLNLGAAFAQMERTLVVGADLRRPTLAAKCGLHHKHPGLSNYVAGDMKLDECITQFGEQGLFVMPAGLIPTNPLELLSSKKFRATLEELGEHFDRIIIDSAPVHAVSDALILATYADTLVYVVGADSTSATIVKRGLQRIKATNTSVAGVILNRFNAEKASKYYGAGEYAYQSYYGADDEPQSRS
ncbi:MAG: hypothetical protein VR73_05875 [Gammaproteobacteria bacterium BRH_c0]|nr:MAG: hypothetical protein VR73_05875 [Gammaproteobacteria bacterium BRH_c0]